MEDDDETDDKADVVVEADLVRGVRGTVDDDDLVFCAGPITYGAKYEFGCECASA